MLWKIAEPDLSLVKEFARALNISGILATLLINRGMTQIETAGKFLTPRLEYLEDPFLMSDLEIAVKRILTAIHLQENILIYGDYDVDGTTAVVILRKALEMLGASTSYYIPRRLVDGYGMKVHVIEHAAAEGVSRSIGRHHGASPQSAEV